MGAMIIDIADAVVQSLNGGSFSQEFTAARSYVPPLEADRISSLRVDVMPRSLEAEFVTRSFAEATEFKLDIGVQQKVGQEDCGTIDSLMQLVEEIAEWFRKEENEIAIGGTAVVLVKTEQDPIYMPERLRSFGVFTGVVTLTFKVLR